MLTRIGAYFPIAVALIAMLSVPALAQNYGNSAPPQMTTPGQQIPGMVMNPETDPNLHPVHPLLGRQFQYGNGNYPQSYTYNNYGSGGTYSYGNGYTYSNGGYGYGGYGGNTIIVPADNGSDYVFGGVGNLSSGGVVLGSNSYPQNYDYPSYNVPLTVPGANAPYVTVVPNPPTYDYSGTYIPVPQPSITNIYNTYNYYPNTGAPATANQAPAQSGSPTGALNPSATPTSPSTQPAASSPTDSANALKPDDADLLATAYTDIQRGWIRGDVSLIKKHVDMTGSISILSRAKYQYSVPSNTFVTSTDNMFDQILTKSFTFTALQRQTNGDITAFATHVYSLRSAEDSDPKRTMYVSYVMRKKPVGWVIVAVDSSQTPLTDTDNSASPIMNSGSTQQYSNTN